MEEKNLKEEKTQKDHSLGMIILVGILVIMLACCFVYIWRMNKIQDLTTQENTVNDNVIESGIVENETNENTVGKAEATNEQSKAKSYTYNDVKGTYKFSKEIKRDKDYKPTADYALYLYPDGTYMYEHSIEAAQGIMGNYMIEGEEIILNKLFGHGSDIGVFAEKGQIKLKINKDGSLTDKNNLLREKELSNIKLKKESSSINKDVDTLSSYVNRYISYLEQEEYKK